MALDDIKTVAEHEKRAADIRAVAQAEAKRLVAEANDSGLDYAAKARKVAEETVHRLMDDARKTAEKQAAEARSIAEERCLQLENAAGERLNRAAQIIVERIVDA